MSNLSELLPSGGGQNVVEFTADGAISSGQAVALQTDGTVAPVSQSTVATDVSSEVSIKNSASGSSGVLYSSTVVYDDANNRYIVAWYDGYRYNIRAGSVASDGTITWGSPLGFTHTGNDGSGFGWDSTNGYGLLVTIHTTWQVRVISISGTTVTSSGDLWGGRSGSGQNYGPTLSFDKSSGRMLVFEPQDQTSGYYYGVQPITINGASSVSIGTFTVIHSYASMENPGAVYDTVNQITVATKTVSGPELVPITDSGSGGVTVGSAVSLGTTSQNGDGLAVSMNGSAGVAVHADYDNATSYYITAYAFDVSGTTITAGSASVLSGTTARTEQYSIGVTYEDRSDTYVTTWNQQSNDIAYYALATKSSSSVTWGSIGTINSTNPNGFVQARRMTYAAAPSTSAGYGFVLFPYNTDNSGTRDQVYRLITPTYQSSNKTDFIGLAADAISDTATGNINVKGGINEAQTGLTIGSDYYVQDNGTLSTTTSTVKVGQAISATTINMMDLT